VCDFLLVINNNLGPILHRFGDTVAYRSKNRQNRQFVPTPVSYIALARAETCGISRWTRYFQKLRVECSGSPTVKKSWRTDARSTFFVLIRTSVVWLYQRLHSLLCYRAGKNLRGCFMIHSYKPIFLHCVSKPDTCDMFTSINNFWYRESSFNLLLLTLTIFNTL